MDTQISMWSAERAVREEKNRLFQTKTKAYVVRQRIHFTQNRVVCSYVTESTTSGNRNAEVLTTGYLYGVYILKERIKNVAYDDKTSGALLIFYVFHRHINDIVPVR